MLNSRFPLFFSRLFIRVSPVFSAPEAGSVGHHDDIDVTKPGMAESLGQWIWGPLGMEAMHNNANPGLSNHGLLIGGALPKLVVTRNNT